MGDSQWEANFDKCFKTVEDPIPHFLSSVSMSHPINKSCETDVVVGILARGDPQI